MPMIMFQSCPYRALAGGRNQTVGGDNARAPCPTRRCDRRRWKTRAPNSVAPYAKTATGRPSTNDPTSIGLSTAARLRAAGAAMHVAIEDSEAVVGAFHFMLMLRLRHQHLEGGVGPRGNRIDPRELNELDQRILKEAFRQARKVQRRLAADYQL